MARARASGWVGFCYAALDGFAPLAEARDETSARRDWRAHADALQAALEREAWDGDWYRRGFFDDGTPLGSASSDECRIDSIAQSWAVLSGRGEPDRATRAMAAVERELISPERRCCAAVHAALRQDRRSIPATSKAIRRAFARMAASTRMPRFGRRWLSQGSAKATRRPNCSRCSIPSTTPARAPTCIATRSSPTSLAADVYATPPYVGRGGWTWYTGSAGWMQRAGVESILGLRMRGEFLDLDPCIPRNWPRFDIRLRHGSTQYEIAVENPEGVSSGVAYARFDEAVIGDRPLRLPLHDDGATHRIHVTLGSSVGR